MSRRLMLDVITLTQIELLKNAHLFGVNIEEGYNFLSRITTTQARLHDHDDVVLKLILKSQEVIMPWYLL